MMTAQATAIEAEHQRLAETGWKEVQVVTDYAEASERMGTMNVPAREADPDTLRKLDKIDVRIEKWSQKLEALDDGDAKVIARIEGRITELEAAAQQIADDAPDYVSEAMKATSTLFLLLLPNGEVRREHRVPRQRRCDRGDGVSHGNGEVEGSAKPDCPTSDQLSDRQLADLFTHQTLGVREALNKAPAVRKRVLLLLLHPGVRSAALAVRYDPNAVDLHAGHDGATFEIFDRLRQKRQTLDPFSEDAFVDDVPAFDRVSKLSDGKLTQLIDVLIADAVTAHLRRPTALVDRLSAHLKVQLRSLWRPDAAWLAGYQRVQLGHLLAQLHGRAYHPEHESRKKSELVAELVKLFDDAAGGTLEDRVLADRINEWLPAPLRPQDEPTDKV